MKSLLLCLVMCLIGMSSAAFSADTDGDGYSDDHELDWGSDPLDANSVPMDGSSLTLIKAFLDKQKQREVSAENIITGKLTVSRQSPSH